MASAAAFVGRTLAQDARSRALRTAVTAIARAIRRTGDMTATQVARTPTA